jgi:amino acid transporter
MSTLASMRRWVIGPPRDPLNPDTRRHIVLAAFFAWVGLGADGLSSSCYGPEEAFVALGDHTELGLYLAFATAVTVFVIALAYNQVIELFPNGGGGYKVATQLIGKHAGLVSGAALIVDYVLTIAISIASGVDALFSLLPAGAHVYKVATEAGLLLLLLTLNLRGMKESVTVLLPVFLGFFVSHVALILYGVIAHADGLGTLVPEAVRETSEMTRDLGWVVVASMFLRAYSLGGGTYTGIEAVSNNINMLKEPRVRTGKLTMFYMALSLAFVAGGIIVLYLLWKAEPQAGKTLNAVTFGAIINDIGGGKTGYEAITLAIVLALEAGLLFVAANTGFLGGPAVMSNMAADYWVPRQFRQLSSRLVTQNGITLMGAAALAILIWSQGSVSLLVVLYSINVFLTFSLSLAGLSIHWVRNRRTVRTWRRRLALSLTGLAVTSSILAVSLVEKFAEGGWETVLITSIVVALCLVIRRHYDQTREQLRKVDQLFGKPLTGEEPRDPPRIDPSQPTAVFFVGKNRGISMHTLLWVQRLFPGHFRNFVFVSVGEVDAQCYDGAGAMRTLQYEIENSLRYYESFCHRHGLAAKSYLAFGADPVQQLTALAEKIQAEFSNCVFFASKLIFANDHFLTRWLHNQTALALQQRLHLQGLQMVILPMKVA